MTSAISKKIARTALAPHIQSLEPPDPVYETSTDPRTGKSKRSRRGFPPGLTKHEEKILLKVRKRARCLDKGFSLCGLRFGWTAIIGFVPVAGDVLNAMLSYYMVIRLTRKCDLPHMVVQRMLFNQAVATSIGLIPIIGDLLMAVWKANSRNAALFEDFLTARAQRSPTSDQPNPRVPPGETSKLVQNSERLTYIDGLTGERQPVAGRSGGIDSQGSSGAGHAASEEPVAKKTPTRRWFWTKSS